MNKEINLLTGESINKGNLHENLVVRIPMVSRKQSEKLGEELYRDYAIYNMREYGYQFGGFHANGDAGSFYHHLLRFGGNWDREGLRYIISASVYTLFSNCSPKLKSALANQKDLSEFDKTILDEYVDRQVKYYYDDYSKFDLEDFIDVHEEDIEDKILYDIPCIKIELKDKKLIVCMEEKEKQLPNSLLPFIVSVNSSIKDNLLELIVRYELYLEFGIHIPRDIYDTWYTDKRYKESKNLDKLKPTSTFGK